MKYLRILFSAAALLLAASCIENDLPYPTIELSIRSIEGEGFTVTGISLVNRTVTLTLDEKTDIRKVTIDKAEFDVATSNPMMTDKEKFISQIRTSQPLSGEFDLRAPLYVTLSLYQDYEWTIVAEQPIARSFTVAGQIGSTLIDTQARTATAYVAEGTDLKAVTVTSLKLGPADITAYSPTAEELSATGFETARLVDVTCHGRTERWMLHVQPTNVKIGVREIDLWNNTAVVTTMVTPEDYATAEIQYRLKGTADWQTTQKGAQDESGIFTSSIAPEWTSLTNDAGIPVKRLVTTKGFYAGQTYEFRLLVGGEETETAEYTAPAGDTIPDANMENPGLSCFTSDNTNAEFWASGNNTFADKLCRQGTFNGMGGSYCAKLAAAAPPLVNIAAGNLMSGIFYKDGLWTGVVEFGQPYNWTARPSGMKVKYHATLGTIDASKHSGARRHRRPGQSPHFRRHHRLERPAPGRFGHQRPHGHLGSGGNHPDRRRETHRLRVAVRRQVDRRRANGRGHPAAQLLRPGCGTPHRQVQHHHLLLHECLRRLHGGLHDECNVRRRFPVGLLTRRRTSPPATQKI